VQGIEVRVLRGMFSAPGLIQANDAELRLVKNGQVRINQANRAGGTPIFTGPAESPLVGGTPSDLWDDTWTPADINSPLFSAAYATSRLSGASPSVTVRVDNIQIRVTYPA